MEGTNFIQKNWTNLAWVAGLLFAAGGAYSEFKVLHKELDQLQKELVETKEQLYKEIESRVDDLETWQAYQEGVHEKKLPEFLK